MSENVYNYTVVVLDLESDDPGIHSTYGPFTSFEFASSIADYVTERLPELHRGRHVHVSRIANFAEFLGGAAARAARFAATGDTNILTEGLDETRTCPDCGSENAVERDGHLECWCDSGGVTS